jgi:hypothetical protein
MAEGQDISAIEVDVSAVRSRSIRWSGLQSYSSRFGYNGDAVLALALEEGRIHVVGIRTGQAG